MNNIRISCLKGALPFVALMALSFSSCGNKKISSENTGTNTEADKSDLYPENRQHFMERQHSHPRRKQSILPDIGGISRRWECKVARQHPSLDCRAALDKQLYKP